MIEELGGIVLVMLFFVVFGLFRPADRGEGHGCGGCEHGGDGSCGSGGSCPMLKDL